MDLIELLDKLSSQIEAMQTQHKSEINDLNSKLDALLDCIAPQSLLVGTAEAGLMLGVSKRTIQDWHTSGKMPKLASGKGEHLRWERSAIEKMAQARKQGGRPRKAA